MYLKQHIPIEKYIYVCMVYVCVFLGRSVSSYVFTLCQPHSLASTITNTLQLLHLHFIIVCISSILQRQTHIYCMCICVCACLCAYIVFTQVQPLQTDITSIMQSPKRMHVWVGKHSLMQWHSIKYPIANSDGKGQPHSEENSITQFVAGKRK